MSCTGPDVADHDNSAEAKDLAVTRTVPEAPFTAENVNLPSALVRVDCVDCGKRSVTSAPGMTAPVVSRTIPLTVNCCAEAEMHDASSNA